MYWKGNMATRDNECGPHSELEDEIKEKIHFMFQYLLQNLPL